MFVFSNNIWIELYLRSFARIEGAQEDRKTSYKVEKPQTSSIFIIDDTRVFRDPLGRSRSPFSRQFLSPPI